MHAFWLDGEGLLGLDEARDLDESRRLGGYSNVVGGGCAEAAWFHWRKALPYLGVALAVDKSRRHDSIVL